MAESHAVTLSLFQSATEHVEVSVFDEYKITLDMLHAGNAWTFACWASSVGENAFRDLKRAVKLGARAVLSIDGAPQLVGPVEEARIKVDRAGGAALILTGRDVAGAAQDWDADPRVNLRGRAVGDVVHDLLGRIGIQAQFTDGASARAAQGRPGRRRPAARPRRHPIDLAHARPGEKVWPLVQEVAKKVGLMAWVAPDAESYDGAWIVLDTPAYADAPVFTFRRALRDGVVVPNGPGVPDLLETEHAVSVKDVPTEVHAYGQAARGDEPAARVLYLLENDALPQYPEVARPVPTHPRWLHDPRATSLAHAKQAAARVMAEGMANFRAYTCKVQGHGQVVAGERRLYTVNTMATVEDPLSNLATPRPLLITRVEFARSRRDGQTTNLTLGQKGAIQIIPEPT